MSFSLGIVGLPNVGKSTLFNAITSCAAEASNYPFCTIDPNRGVVSVPDNRLDHLAQMHHSQKIVPTYIEFVDIAGLVKGASEGEGLGNQFLANIREVKAIVHVVRCFDDENIIHVNGKVDPLEDIEIINTELIMADLGTIDKKLDAISKKIKGNDKEAKEQYEFFLALKTDLQKSTLARQIQYTDKQLEWLRPLNLLTQKPVIYVANVDEETISKPDGNQYVGTLKAKVLKENAEVIMMSSKLESELVGLEPEEALEFRKELGIKESGMQQLIVTSYQLLDLITYFTSGEKETRAWTIKQGTRAPQAAGVIHTDFEKGFIKAEVIQYTKLSEAGSLQKAKELGWIRIEGKEYLVLDGDVMLFRFNV